MLAELKINSLPREFLIRYHESRIKSLLERSYPANLRSLINITNRAVGYHAGFAFKLKEYLYDISNDDQRINNNSMHR